MLDLKSVDMRFMYLMELSGKDIYVGDKKCKRVKIYVGRPLRDTPKTYKRIGGFVAKELSNAYNSSCVSIYEAKDKTLRYSVYRDGCFLSLLREIRGGRIIPRGTGGGVTAWQATGVDRRSFWRGNIKY